MLLSSNESLKLSGTGAIAKVDPLVHLYSLLIGVYAGRLHENFAIVAISIAPLQILVWCFFKVHFDVLERVLLDVSDSQVGMLLDFASLWNGFTCQQLDQS